MFKLSSIITATVIAASVVATPAQASAPKPHLAGVVQDDGHDALCHRRLGELLLGRRQVGPTARGHSFYSVKVGDEMCTIYAEKAYNRTHGYCTGSAFDGFGPRWEQVSPRLARQLHRYEDRSRSAARFQSCAVRYGNTTVVICPDGKRYTS